jgi:hypothetical protein
MDDAFIPSRDDDCRSQHSQRSNTRSGNGYRESESNSGRCDPRDGGGGKTPYKGGEDYNCGTKEDFGPGDKMPQGDNDKQRQQKLTMMKRRTRRSTQKGGLITTTQGLRDNHTTFPLGDSNNQSYLTQGCYNPRHLQQHPLHPLQQAHQHIQA